MPEQIEPVAETAQYVYIFQVINKGHTSIVRKDLGELVDFMKELDQLFNGFVDSQLCLLLSPDVSINLAEEFDKSIKQKFAEQFESLTRIPFISSGNIFRRFFDINSPIPMNASAENSFEKSLMDGDLPLKTNPFERRLTESVPPKNTRMTL